MIDTVGITAIMVLAMIIVIAYWSVTYGRRQRHLDKQFSTFLKEAKETQRRHSSSERTYNHKKTHCVSCGAAANPLRAACEYCGTAYEQAAPIYPKSSWSGAVTGILDCISGIAYMPSYHCCTGYYEH